MKIALGSLGARKNEDLRGSGVNLAEGAGGRSFGSLRSFGRPGGAFPPPKNNPGRPGEPFMGVKGPSAPEDKSSLKLADTVVRGILFLTVFLLPLFFLTNTPSPLELSKQMFLTLAVGAAFLAWVGKMAWKNEIRMRKNFFLVPLASFLLIFGLSTIFSQYVNQSLWGYFGGENEGYVSMVFFAAFFILIFNNIKEKKDIQRMVYFFLAGGILVFLLSLLQLFGRHLLPGAITKNDFFNTVGSIYILSVFLASAFLISLASFMGSQDKRKTGFFAFLSVVLFIGVAIFKLTIIWWGLILVLAFILGLSIVDPAQRNSQKRILAMVFLVLSLVMLYSKNSFLAKDFPVEVFLKQRTGAEIMLSAWKTNPMLGVGPANFVSTYQMNRPDGLRDFWSVNFNSSSSLLVTLTSNTGILGSLVFLFLLAVAGFFITKGSLVLLSNSDSNRKSEENAAFIGLSAVWLFLTFIACFYFFNMTIWLVWWMSLGIIFSLISSFRKDGLEEEFVTNSNSPGSSLTLSFVFVLVIIGFITAIYTQGQKYMAAVYFNQALAADAQGGNIEEVTAKIQKAVQLDPKRDVYYRNLSVASFALANKRIADKGQEELSTEDIAYVKNMISQARSYSETAVALNPSPENYISLAQVYEGVLFSMDGAEKEVIDNYQSAIQVDPRNPNLYVKLASVYISLANWEAGKERERQAGSQNPSTELPEKSKEYLIFAKEQLAKAREVKGDHPDANLLLASVYEMEGDLEAAIEKEKENKQIFPGTPELFFRLGLLYYKKESWNEAREEFKGAVAINKDYSNARYFLGLVYDKQKEKKLAIEQFERVMELNPENETVKSILDNLKNGKEALAGLDDQQIQQKQAEAAAEKIESNQGEEEQIINPQVQPQEIPKEAVPGEEEVNQPQPTQSPEN